MNKDKEFNEELSTEEELLSENAVSDATSLKNMESVIDIKDIKKHTMPMIPLRNMVFFPNRRYQLDIVNKKELKAIKHAFDNDMHLFFVTQKDDRINDAEPSDCYEIGTTANIVEKMDVKGGGQRIVVNTHHRAKFIDHTQKAPFHKVMIELIDSGAPVFINSNIEPNEERIKNLITKKRIAINGFEKYVSIVNPRAMELVYRISKLREEGLIADIIADQLPINVEIKQKLLSCISAEERFDSLLVPLYSEIKIAETQRDLEEKVKKQISKKQKDYFLREQIKAINEELGEDQGIEDEVIEMKERLEALKLPEEIDKKILKEINRYFKLGSHSAESAVSRTYINLILELPWHNKTADETDLLKAESVLEGDHYGLEKVKERILEYLAVRTLSDKMKGQIICLVGPPGVGKTSIAKSIAHALNRKYYRMSLGGVRDAAEIMGHRRTYIGAIPGRIINCVKEAGTSNPVILLDEIDKLSSDFRGDPAGALLEVLDPEQNKDFTDHYLEVPFDLSDVLFITTANSLSTIPRPLLDRMEVIEVSGYTEDEKVGIASKYLVTKKLAEHGIKRSQFKMTEGAIREIIRSYTRESGVRELERQISTICRKVAVRFVKGEIKSVTIGERTVKKYLGKQKYKFGVIANDDQIGIVTGLAWTSVGGETLSVEVNLLEGGEGRLKITGQIGDVMKESAEAALSYVRMVSKDYGIDEELFKTKDIHIHVPEGAIPKDGPSAGVTIATALISAFSMKGINRFVAMTGEITLRGRVLPIGGLKEKSLAAIRAGIKTVLYPAENVGEFEELPDVVKETLEFVPVKNMKQVLKRALVN